MGKQIFDRMRKTLGILLAVCFVMSITAAAVSAVPNPVNIPASGKYTLGSHILSAYT